MINCQNCGIGMYDRVLNGNTITAKIKPDDMVGGENTEYLSGKAGKANYKICTSKDNGFSLVTDKGYVSVNPQGQVTHCKTLDDNGDTKTLNLYA